MNAEKLAQGLGWFSIGLGATEVFAAEAVADYLGIKEQAGLTRAFGFREITAGIGILAGGDAPHPGWVWARVAGDALDLAVLGSALKSDNPRLTQAAVWFGLVAGITALDVAVAQSLGAKQNG